MNGSAAALTLAFGLATWGGFQAHEGYKHPEEQVAGTVVQVHQSGAVTHIEVKTAKGDTVVLSADSTTKYLKGKIAATPADVTPGLRIVTKAPEISLGIRDSDAHQDGNKHPHGTTQEHDLKH